MTRHGQRLDLGRSRRLRGSTGSASAGRRWLAATALAACTLSACTATVTPDTDRLRSTRPGPTAGAPTTTTPTGPASTAPAPPSPSSPPAGCPTPAPATAAPTDFPHPELVRHPVAADTARADATLAQQGLTAVRLFGGPVATTAFQHYLDATGT